METAGAARRHQNPRLPTVQSWSASLQDHTELCTGLPHIAAAVLSTHWVQPQHCDVSVPIPCAITLNQHLNPPGNHQSSQKGQSKKDWDSVRQVQATHRDERRHFSALSKGSMGTDRLPNPQLELSTRSSSPVPPSAEHCALLTSWPLH